MQEEGDYTVHAVDTDILVNWDLIEQVVRPTWKHVSLTLLMNNFNFFISACSVMKFRLAQFASIPPEQVRRLRTVFLSEAAAFL